MGYQAVDGPLPAPANVGLRAARGPGTAVIENPDPPGTRWLGGYRFRREPCKCGTRRGGVCSTFTKLEAPTPLPWRDVKPFTVGCARTCGTTGWTEENLAVDAATSLDLVQYEEIAAELWSGDIARANGWPNPFLADASSPGFVNLVADQGGATADGFDYVEGLAVLEDALADCHTGMGVIHAPVIMSARWASESVIVKQGNRFFTHAGNQVIFDAGYNGSGPNARVVTDAATTNADATLTSADADFTAADVGAGISGAGIPAGATIASVTNESTVEMSANATATATGVTVTITNADGDPTPATDGGVWVYATGPLQIRIDTGPPTITPPAGRFYEAVNRANNEISYLAERAASVTWNCCHFGARLLGGGLRA